MLGNLNIMNSLNCAKEEYPLSKMGNRSLFSGQAVSTDGPSTEGNYIWIETDDWPKWETKLVCGLYVHHVACIYGKFIPILDEARKYIGDIKRDFV